MKKILFVSLNDHVPWGGSEELWYNAALLLNATLDISVFVKKWNEEPSQIKALRDKGIKVLYKNKSLFEKSNSLLSKVKTKFKNKKNSKSDLELIEGIEQFNMVVLSVGNHTDAKIISYTNYLIRYHIPYVIIVQLATDLRYISDAFIEQLASAYMQAKTVFFVSEENALKTEIQFGAQVKNKAIINNPFFYEQHYTPIETKTFNLACVAAFTSFHKGQDLLIYVLSQEKWKKRQLYLNLYGSGTNKKQLTRLIALYGLEDKVKIKDFQANKTTIWKENMACIMPSRMEGQSLAMLEAMSHGRMIISTRVGDAERLIINKKTGFIIDAPTVQLIDKALENAWSMKEEWKEMGVSSRDHLYNVITDDPVIELSGKLEKLI